jgi:hypothetical protein
LSCDIWLRVLPQHRTQGISGRSPVALLRSQEQRVSVDARKLVASPVEQQCCRNSNSLWQSRAGAKLIYNGPRCNPATADSWNGQLGPEYFISPNRPLIVLRNDADGFGARRPQDRQQIVVPFSTASTWLLAWNQ